MLHFHDFSTIMWLLLRKSFRPHNIIKGTREGEKSRKMYRIDTCKTRNVTMKQSNWESFWNHVGFAQLAKNVPLCNFSNFCTQSTKANSNKMEHCLPIKNLISTSLNGSSPLEIWNPQLNWEMFWFSHCFQIWFSKSHPIYPINKNWIGRFSRTFRIKISGNASVLV